MKNLKCIPNFSKFIYFLIVLYLFKKNQNFLISNLYNTISIYFGRFFFYFLSVSYLSIWLKFFQFHVEKILFFKKKNGFFFLFLISKLLLNLLIGNVNFISSIKKTINYELSFKNKIINFKEILILKNQFFEKKNFKTILYIMFFFSSKSLNFFFFFYYNILNFKENLYYEKWISENFYFRIIKNDKKSFFLKKLSFFFLAKINIKNVKKTRFLSFLFQYFIYKFQKKNNQFKKYYLKIVDQTKIFFFTIKLLEDESINKNKNSFFLLIFFLLNKNNFETIYFTKKVFLMNTFFYKIYTKNYSKILNKNFFYMPMKFLSFENVNKKYQNKKKFSKNWFYHRNRFLFFIVSLNFFLSKKKKYEMIKKLIQKNILIDLALFYNKIVLNFNSLIKKTIFSGKQIESFYQLKEIISYILTKYISKKFTKLYRKKVSISFEVVIVKKIIKKFIKVKNFYFIKKQNKKTLINNSGLNQKQPSILFTNTNIKTNIVNVLFFKLLNFPKCFLSKFCFLFSNQICKFNKNYKNSNFYRTFFFNKFPFSKAKKFLKTTKIKKHAVIVYKQIFFLNKIFSERYNYIITVICFRIKNIFKYVYFLIFFSNFFFKYWKRIKKFYKNSITIKKKILHQQTRFYNNISSEIIIKLLK